MIASLSGTVSEISSGQIVVEVNSVGYLLNTTTRTSSNLSIAQQVRLYTSLIVREDSLTLFGFINTEELEYFDLLRSVNGVGPKSALAILSQLSVDQVAEAVVNESDSAFKSVSGIGAKTAKLIVVTLAGKVKSDNKSATVGSESTVAALVGLGWSEKQARDAVLEVSDKSLADKELLKAALQKLSKARKV